MKENFVQQLEPPMKQDWYLVKDVIQDIIDQTVRQIVWSYLHVIPDIIDQNLKQIAWSYLHVMKVNIDLLQMRNVR